MLCEGLKDNHTLKNLNIAKNDITVSGLEPLAEILSLTSVEDLDLSMNPLGNAGIAVLSQAISR